MDNKEIRTSRVQYHKMVELLEGVPDIARAMFKGDQTKFWEDMAEHLNALGPPIRSGATWKRVWFDYKCAVKKKLRANKASLLATGGGKFHEKPLNDVEERVANLTNLNATVEGNSARSFGIIPAPSIDQADNNSEQQQTNTEKKPEEQIATVPQAKKRRIKRKNTEEVLRQNQELLNLIKIQIEVQKESTAALKEATLASKAQIEAQQQSTAALKEATKAFNAALANRD